MRNNHNKATIRHINKQTNNDWIKACDAMLQLEPELVVPGHGPVTDVRGIRDVKA